MDLFYQESGNKAGPLIVFLHGGGVSGWMWEKQIAYFEDYHCLVPDLQGHGQSKSEIDFSIERCADTIITLIEQKSDGKQVAVVGFSLGAQLTIEIIHKKPNLVNYAIINSALIRPMPVAKKFIKPTIKAAYSLIQNRHFSRLQANQLYITENDFEKYYNESKKMTVQMLISILEENMSYQLPLDISQSETKVLVTVGKKEKRVMKKSAVDLVRSNLNCKGIIIPGIGHGAPLASPALFNQIIAAWISDNELPDGLVLIKD